MKNNDTNVYGQPLQVCSYKPLTGYDRTGYCSSSKNDKGKHWVCGKMDKEFLQFTKKKGNDLTSVVKPGDNWCLCEDRFIEAHSYRKSPRVIGRSTNRKVANKTKKIIKNQNKTFLYNPDNPESSFDVYIDKDPSDTISIKYSTVDDVKNTISKLEYLYKNKKYSHKRIWQVGMILKVRLEAIYNKRHTKYKKAINIEDRFKLANKYFKFLGKRTKLSEKERYKAYFKT